jgi:hypothetical protein
MQNSEFRMQAEQRVLLLHSAFCILHSTDSV